MALEKEIDDLTKEKNNLVDKNEQARDLGERLSKKIACKEEGIELLDTKIADVQQKQGCVSKKISKAEKLIKHLLANKSKINCTRNDWSSTLWISIYIDRYILINWVDN